MDREIRISASITAIILAAGMGTRMRSARHKVLHPLAGRPMIAHVLAAVGEAGAAHTVVVLGHAAETVRAVLPPEVLTVVQEPQLGTGHAVRVALDALPANGNDADEDGEKTALILYGDMPLITPATLHALIDAHHRAGARLTLLSARLPDPTGYGRILRDAAGRVTGIKEHKELAPGEETIDEINCGVSCVDLPWLRRAIARLPEHPDGEYYLPDLVPLAIAEGGVEAVVTPDADEAQGVNTRVQLAEAGRLLRRRINEGHMLSGVTLIDPATAYIEPGVRIGRDTVIHPNTHLRGATRIGADCHIGPDTDIADSEIADDAEVTRSVVERARIGARCHVGPFSHLRPGTILHEDVEVGNYAELKNSTLGAGAANHHVGYLGDATVGPRTNIGAGTITANYDGKRKYATTIGADVFVGSDTVLRAPVTLGDGSATGAGAVVTHDVPPGMLVTGVPAREHRSKPLGKALPGKAPSATMDGVSDGRDGRDE